MPSSATKRTQPTIPRDGRLHYKLPIALSAHVQATDRSTPVIAWHRRHVSPDTKTAGTLVLLADTKSSPEGVFHHGSQIPLDSIRGCPQPQARQVSSEETRPDRPLAFWANRRMAVRAADRHQIRQLPCQCQLRGFVVRVQFATASRLLGLPDRGCPPVTHRYRQKYLSDLSMDSRPTPHGPVLVAKLCKELPAARYLQADVICSAPAASGPLAISDAIRRNSSEVSDNEVRIQLDRVNRAEHVGRALPVPEPRIDDSSKLKHCLVETVDGRGRVRVRPEYVQRHLSGES